MSTNIKLITKLHTILTEKGWGTDREEKKSGKKLFQIFAEIMEQLNEKQSLLLLHLISKFKIYKADNYSFLLKKAFEDISFSNHQDAKIIYLIPLVHWKDIKKEKFKSGHSFLYQIQNQSFIKIAPPLHGKKIEILRDYVAYDSKKESFKTQKKCFIFFDDFIGTGDTAIRTINEFSDEYNIDFKDIYLISLVAMQHGLERLYDSGVNIGVGEMANKGISDDPYLSGKITENINTMLDIEKEFSVPPTYELGYGRSEALISMIRTPNNTFPLFWFTNKKLDVPFPRF
ncbi:hypothetical protein [Maridesulfovibrio ferrireducens]|uniref:phosphoribosyltransferase-like protein n=1 Tax=Maridesulfovibrio ferrireducens TaxID=246191 RepID=UPI001A297D72|nr:hypothetical protein [Maridesulfovibrio ferrireducens]MBI9110129.1 hypothetical protein [Maridesulfovibrio ferrireducens]